MEALSWFGLSQRLGNVSLVGNSSLAKLHRNMASAHLNIGEVEKAAEELTVAARLEPGSPSLLFLRFKLALLRDNELEGMIYRESRVSFKGTGCRLFMYDQSAIEPKPTVEMR